jgi:hypothetical protein
MFRRRMCLETLNNIMAHISRYEEWEENYPFSHPGEKKYCPEIRNMDSFTLLWFDIL